MSKKSIPVTNKDILREGFIKQYEDMCKEDNFSEFYYNADKSENDYSIIYAFTPRDPENYPRHSWVVIYDKINRITSINHRILGLNVNLTFVNGDGSDIDSLVKACPSTLFNNLYTYSNTSSIMGIYNSRMTAGLREYKVEILKKLGFINEEEKEDMLEEFKTCSKYDGYEKVFKKYAWINDFNEFSQDISDDIVKACCLLKEIKRRFY